MQSITKHTKSQRDKSRIKKFVRKTQKRLFFFIVSPYNIRKIITYLGGNNYGILFG